MSRLSGLRLVIDRFVVDRRGNFPVMLAFMLIPIIGLLGLGVDFSLALRTKTALDASTDAALLAAATEAEQVIQTYSTANYDATPAAIMAGQQAGQQVFLANSARVQTTTPAQLTLNLQRQGSVISATGSYSAQSPTVFGKMFGTALMHESGTAASSLTLPKYLNIYIAVDISQSMGIASTQADMNALTAAIKDFYRNPMNTTQANGCVFGCHVPAPWQNAGDPSMESIAHLPKYNVTLRIDVLKKSILSMISTAQSLTSSTPRIKIGLYTMQQDNGTDGIHSLTTLQPLTSVNADPTQNTALTNAASNLDLGNNDSTGLGDSNLPTALTNLAALPEVSASGDGSSANSPQNFVFVMTDGLYDVTPNPTWLCKDTHCTQNFNSSWCDAFKSKGITVGVLYTTYVPFPTEQTYIDLVQNYQPSIAPNLQSCASPGYYFEASDGPAIQTAAQKLFALATSEGALTR